ncbi:hypothetical protein [Paenibacillus glacialis]|uniref:Uncharacterized protein n=1 Tax=Paenibacillus glacialis TaxID=494026 RepID=A0A168M3H8_9BACL|nr:hypothetical protein [Paenibacillus glacialis]OAB44174.1 hypothetical protein PGLA_05745 [Paenibacillus glacialis]
MIDKSKVNFEESIFLTRVFDKHYVKSKVYSDLLVSEIPKRQRTNIAIEVILQRNMGDIHNLRYFMESIFENMEESDISQVYKVISEELKFTSSDDDIRPMLYILPVQYWIKIEKVVRLRTESILFENVKSGKYDRENNDCISGSLGTWIEIEHLMNFEDLSHWTTMVIEKLENGDDEDKDYIYAYFLDKIYELNYQKISYSLKNYIKIGLRNRDQKIMDDLEGVLQLTKSHPWWKVFEIELKDFPEIKYTDLPF